VREADSIVHVVVETFRGRDVDRRVLDWSNDGGIWAGTVFRSELEVGTCLSDRAEGPEV
jgi:hypothetical protein